MHRQQETRNSTNGHEQAHTQAQTQPGFTEDDEGSTLDSGASMCRFNAQNGGRLERWQWRTRPPREAQNPAMRHDPARLLDLVVPDGGALVDHFLPLGTRPDEVASGSHQEYGDFADNPFPSQTVDSGGEIRIGLLRDGTIQAGKRTAEVRLAKSAALRHGGSDLAVLYRVINASLRPMQILFAVEFNLYAPGLDKPGSEEAGYYLLDNARPEDPTLKSSGVSPNVTHVALVNPEGEMALQLGWDRECDLWRMPDPAGGPGVRLLSIWRLQLPPKDNWAMGLWLAPS
jgi:hypothetical protein